MNAVINECNKKFELLADYIDLELKKGNGPKYASIKRKMMIATWAS